MMFFYFVIFIEKNLSEDLFSQQNDNYIDFKGNAVYKLSIFFKYVFKDS